MLTSALASSRPKSCALAVACLFAAGAWLWHAFDRGSWYSPQQFWLLALQAVIVSLPPINDWIGRQLDRLTAPSPRARAFTALTIGCAATLYLYLSALQQHRDFFPKYHDEYMHLIQARLLSHGQLWAAPHPLPQFLETFHVFVTPVYVGQHFPGAALVYVPGMWLHLPWFLTSLAVAAAAVAMLYRVVAEMIDGVAGLLGAIMLLATLELRYVSLMVLSNPIALLLGLLIIWAWLRWRNDRRPRWALAIGFVAGWAAITRPQDALCFAIPIAVNLLLDLREARVRRWSSLRTFTFILLAAIPFLVLQLIFDRGVTGHWLATPHQFYGHIHYPGVTYGLHPPDLSRKPATSLPQKLDYYNGFITEHMLAYTPASAWRSWIEQRFPMLLKASLPSPLLIVLLPVGLLDLSVRRRWTLAAIAPLFLLFYALNIMFSAEYALLLTVATLPLVILGARSLEAAIEALIPALRHRLRPILTVLLLAISLAALPQLSSSTEQFPAPTIESVERALSHIDGRALVFFRYQRGQNVHEEPVYNIEAADIDANRIVRAQDLGPAENVKLLRYYAARQPDRQAYRFDRSDRTLTPLGPVTRWSDTTGASIPEVPDRSDR